MKKDPVAIITALTFLMLIIVAFYGLIWAPGSGPDKDWGFLYDGIFFFALTAVLYWNYDRFNQTYSSYALLLGLIWFHIAGAFWLYGRIWGVVEFDMIIHAVGGFVLSFFFYRFVEATKNPSITILRAGFIVLLCVLGLSVIHELLEFFGYTVFGEGSGIFMYGPGDFGAYHDIAWDFISNLLGAIPGTLAAFKFYGDPR